VQQEEEGENANETAVDVKVDAVLLKQQQEEDAEEREQRERLQRERLQRQQRRRQGMESDEKLAIPQTSVRELDGPSRSSSNSEQLRVHLDGQLAVPEGKQYHYYISHQNQHSKHGSKAALLATRLHADLRERGFTGIVGGGAAGQVALERLRAEVGSSCTMIVCLHDETIQCRRCVEEWRAAVRVGMPIQCLVDVQHSAKGKIARKFEDLCRGSDGGEDFRVLQELQWVKCTEHNRDAGVRVLEFFLRDAL
jgi:hypothetical protein